jgi:hypothetical protein
MFFSMSRGMQGDTNGNFKRSEEGRRVARRPDVVEGWWDNISSEPVYIKDKYHLKQVCQEQSRRTGREIIPRMFAKTKSQGKGIEWSF